MIYALDSYYDQVLYQLGEFYYGCKRRFWRVSMDQGNINTSNLSLYWRDNSETKKGKKKKKMQSLRIFPLS